MKKYGVFRFVFGYVVYLVKSHGPHKVHSPFVYRLYTRVIRSKEKFRNSRIENVIAGRTNQNTRIAYEHPDGITGPIMTTVGIIASTASKSDKYKQLLFRISKDQQVKTGLEIGTSLGFSTMYLASANEDSRWVTLEGVTEIADMARENFSSAGCTNIEVITGPFDVTLPEWLRNSPPPDMVFFDGNHRFQATMDYFELCLPVRSTHAVFVLDDIHWSPEMEKAWEAIKNHPEVVTTIDLYMCGLVYFDKSRSREHFVLRF